MIRNGPSLHKKSGNHTCTLYVGAIRTLALPSLASSRMRIDFIAAKASLMCATLSVFCATHTDMSTGCKKRTDDSDRAIHRCDRDGGEFYVRRRMNAISVLEQRFRRNSRTLRSKCVCALDREMAVPDRERQAA